MNLQNLFSTKERVNIIEDIIYSEKEFGVNEISKKLKLSKGLVSKYMNILQKEDLITRKKNKFVVNENNKVKSIKIMLNILKIDTKIFKKYKFVKIVGLYGSNVKGTNTKTSDIDLWIRIGKVKEEEVAELTSELNKKVENIKILILDNEKIDLLKKKDIVFYYSLYFGSIIIYGEEDEI